MLKKLTTYNEETDYSKGYRDGMRDMFTLRRYKMIEFVDLEDYGYLDIADSVSIDADAEQARQDLLDDDIEMQIDFEREGN